jgi:outer membrane protein OmpA-like peptidoglycan-associated protein
LIEQRDRAQRQLSEARASELEQTRQQLTAAGHELAGRKQALDAEKKAHAEAEARGAEVIRKMAATVATSVKSEERGQVLVFAADGLFESGKAALVAAARVKLTAVADAIKTQPGRRILIEGHTDSRGDGGANQALGLGRAQAVKDHLASTGLKAELIEVQGIGSARPLGDNATPDGRATNRRIEIIIRAK